jgi:hypothetical protein
VHLLPLPSLVSFILAMSNQSIVLTCIAALSAQFQTFATWLEKMSNMLTSQAQVLLCVERYDVPLSMEKIRLGFLL